MSIKADVLRYLEDHPNVRVYSQDIAAEVDITLQQVYSAIQAIKNTEALAPCLSSHGNGIYVWSSRPAGEAGQLFEKLGEARDGRLVLQDDEGNLFVATAL